MLKRKRDFRQPRFVKTYKDRNAVWIRQYRRGGKLTRLTNGLALDDAFWDSYREAEALFASGGSAPRKPRAIGATRTTPGTVSGALVGFYASIGFRNMAPNSQRSIRGALERDVRVPLGAVQLARLKPSHIAKSVADKADTSISGARQLLAAWRLFGKYCVNHEGLGTNPALAVERPANKSEGHRCWTEDEIATFEKVHPIGSDARLALGLQVFTTQRPGDVRRMGWKDVRDGKIRIVQEKTGMPVAIPLDFFPELRAELDRLPVNQGTFLVNADGNPFSARGYNDRWRRWIAEAGLLPDLVPHGLRKAGITRLADRGCSTQQIMGVSGHKTLAEVERYTKSANREHNAAEAMAQAYGTNPERKVSRSVDHARQNAA